MADENRNTGSTPWEQEQRVPVPLGNQISTVVTNLTASLTGTRRNPRCLSLSSPNRNPSMHACIANLNNPCNYSSEVGTTKVQESRSRPGPGP
jgi:hypothetical protein